MDKDDKRITGRQLPRPDKDGCYQVDQVKVGKKQVDSPVGETSMSAAVSHLDKQ